MTDRNLSRHDSEPAPVAIVGAGPAGLFAAEHLARAGHRVVVVERMPSPGRKFLMAGRGGLNLTHSEPLEPLLTRYGADAPAQVLAAIRAFPPQALVAWAHGLGIETFTGSSGRIFPKSLKASPLLRAWLQRLASLGVEIRTRQRWTGWDADGALRLTGDRGGVSVLAARATMLALGGASWPRLGSDGGWAGVLEEAGVAVSPLAPSNAGLLIGWSEHLKVRFAGAPLKRIAVTFDGTTRTGEAVITRGGLEGGVIYALTRSVREALARGERAVIRLDLRPGLEPSDLARRLSAPRGKQSTSNVLRKAAGLAPPAIALVREASGGPLPGDPEALAALIKSVALPVDAVAGLERAISTAGGVGFKALDDAFMIRALPGVFVAGEMLDWEAPTGGYLLQAAFATGHAAALGMAAWLDRKPKL